MEGPLILVLVKFLLKFIAYLFSLIAAPITIYSIIVNKILKLGDCRDNSSLHFLIFIPRIILVLPFFFSFPLLAYLYGWLVDKAINGATYIPFVIAIGFLFAIAVGYWFTRSLSFFKDSISKMKIVGEDSYFKGVGESLLDIGAVIAFLLSTVTIIRIPFMIVAVFSRDSFDNDKKSIRKNLYLHMFLIIFDILCLPAFLFTLITVLRAKPLFETITKKYNTVWRKCFNLQLRLCILQNACIAIFQIFVILLSFLFVFAPWRVKYAIREFKRGKTQGEKFGLYFVQEMNGVLDDIVILMSTPLLLTFYRLPYSIRKIFSNDNSTAGSRRSEALFQTLFVFVDLFIMLFSVFIIITIYRLPRTIRKIIDRPGDYYGIIGMQFLKIWLDVPFLLMAFVVTILLWRAPFMYAQIYKETTKKKRRDAIKHHFLWLWIDILDLPFVLCTFIILLTLWRAYAFVVGFITLDTRRKQRIYVIKQIFYWLMDIPTFLGFLLITITVYRLPKTIRLLRNYFKYTDYQNDSRSINNASNSNSRNNNRNNNNNNYYISSPQPTQRQQIHFQTNDDMIIQNTNNYNNNENEDNPPPPFQEVQPQQQQTTINSINHDDDNEDNPLPPSPAPPTEATTTTMSKLKLKSSKLSTTTVKNTNNKYEEELKLRFTSWRKVVLNQLFLLLIDIPFPLLLLMTMWRLPILISRLKEINDPIRKYSLRRLLILRYVLYTFLDILCLVPTLFILMTVWRIPSFVSMVKQYQRGDNEHKKVGLLFWETLVDIPFVLMGLLTLPVPWRGAFLIRTIFFKKECKNDKEARIMAAKYLAFTLLDIIIFIELLFLACTMWRLKTFYSFFKKEVNDKDANATIDINLRFRTSVCLFYTASITCAMVFVDIFKMYQVLVICCFIKQVVPLYRAIKKKKQDTPDFTLKDTIGIISCFYMRTLMDIPHVLLIPIKLLAIPFIPIHLYLKKRTGIKVDSNVNGDIPANENVFMGFIYYPLIWFHQLSVNLLNYYGLDKFFIINMFGAGLILINELSLFIVAFNFIYMFLVTLGSPAWKETMNKYGWNALGKAQGPLVILEYITVVLQACLFPLFILMQIAILLLPTLLAFGFYPNPNLDFVNYWKGFFSDRSFWREASHFSNGIWVAQAFWVLVCAVSWQISFKVGKKYVPIFSPWKSYYWLVKKVFHGRIWFCYTWLLIKGTKVCYRLRRVCLVGELMMFPLFIIWTCWPFIIPIATKIYYIFIGSGIVTLTLFVFAYRIIKQNWSDDTSSSMELEKNGLLFHLQSVDIQLPDSGGLIFTFNASKDISKSNTQIRDARLSLEGESLWEAIYSIVGRTKVRAAMMVVGYPISLVPMFLDIEEVNRCSSNDATSTFQLKIGIEGSKFLMKKKLLLRLLNQIKAIDDSSFEFVIEHGKKNFGWEKHGLLLKFKTNVSAILENTINNLNQFIEPIQYSAPPIPPPNPKYLQKPKPLQTPIYKNNDVDNNDDDESHSPDQAGINIRDSIDGGYRHREVEEEEEVDQHFSSDFEIDPEQVEIERKIQEELQAKRAAIAAVNETLPPPPPPPPSTSTDQVSSSIYDMGNYISDDQDNEEFYKSLDKSNNV